MRYSSFDSILYEAKSRSRVKAAVAAAADRDVLEAVRLAQEVGFVEPVLVGDVERIGELASQIGLDLQRAELVNEPDPEIAVHKAVDAIVDGRAHFLIKGLVNTSDFVKAVLRSDRGLRTEQLLCHLAAFEVPGFPHLIFNADGGINIAPDLAQKKLILQSSLEYLHSIGMETVNVVAISANEVPNPKMPSAMDAKALTEMAEAGEFPGAIVEGPLALDCAVSSAALEQKGIKSRINGKPDLLLTPTIEVGNTLGKSLVYFAGATMAGIVLGAKVPIVLTSRSDTPKSKLTSIAMASLSRK